MMASRSRLRLAAAGENPIPHSKSGGEGGTERKPEEALRREVTDLGGGSEVVHVPRFVPREAAWGWFDYLDKRIPWTRPTIRVFGRSAVQVQRGHRRRPRLSLNPSF
ncbi:Os06g0286310 [Oryza sativa Japonica Group]|uniref:Os06g0286310 protein n=1 Tax=Oryza sativa subsp. japonica TaxID=39947 RepID=A0A0P0WVQ1_ORYSJ|nr:hypothetical protein EE612_033420 [Oryza sativa]BAS97279.1 Os06g0286310 [Oryza sativa Japonica Group]